MPRPTADAFGARPRPLEPTSDQTTVSPTPRPRATTRRPPPPPAAIALGTPSHVTDAILAALYAGRLPNAPIEGMPELRGALAARLGRRHGLDAPSGNEVLLTNGAAHGLFVTFAALLAPGDEVIVPTPGWPGIADAIRLAGGVPVGVPLRPELGWTWRPEDVDAAVTARTAAICVDTPHNPTGAVLPRDTVLALIEVARRHDLWLVADEVFDDTVYASRRHHSPTALAGVESHRVVGIFACARTAALGGLRVGYVVSRSAAVRDRLRMTLRATTGGVSPLAQWAAHAAVTARDDGNDGDDALRQRRDATLAALDGIPGLHAVAPAGTPFVWATLHRSLYPRLEVADAESLAAALAVDGIASVPGRRFGAAYGDAIRFAFADEATGTPQYLARLRDALL